MTIETNKPIMALRHERRARRAGRLGPHVHAIVPAPSTRGALFRDLVRRAEIPGRSHGKATSLGSGEVHNFAVLTTVRRATHAVGRAASSTSHDFERARFEDVRRVLIVAWHRQAARRRIRARRPVRRVVARRRRGCRRDGLEGEHELGLNGVRFVGAE